MATAHSSTTRWKVNWGGRLGGPKPLEPIRVSGLHELETINHYCFGGRAPLFSDFRALIVSPDDPEPVLSLALQLLDTRATVAYWNDDPHVLESFRDLARRHGLEQRIRWLTGPMDALRSVFDDGFHYVACEGLLDRVDDPGVAIETIRSLLDDDGAIGISTNGKYGRYAADAMRDLVSHVVTEDDSRDQKVRLAKGLLRSLGPMNWTRLGMDDLPPEVAQATDDQAIHALCFGQDTRSFSIDEVYDLLDMQGLNLVEFERSGRPYYQPFFSYGSPEFQSMVEDLPLRDQHTVAELVWCLIGRHRLWASASTTPTIRPGDLEAVPSYNRYAAVAGVDWQRFFRGCGDHANLSIRLHGEYQASMRIAISPAARRFLELVDGHQTLAQIVETVAAEQKATGDAVRAECVELLGAVWSLDAILLRHKSIDPLPFWDHVAAGRFQIR